MAELQSKRLQLLFFYTLSISFSPINIKIYTRYMKNIF